MEKNTKEYKDKSPKKKNRTTKMNQNVVKTNIFNSKNLNIMEKDKAYIQKKRKRSLSYKKGYFKAEKISALHKKYKKQSLHDMISNNKIWEKMNRTDRTFSKKNILSGINWKKLKTLIPTKTTAEIKSFAKKFFYKMKCCKDDNLGIDFTLNSINNLKDMINQIKSKYPNYNQIFLILKKLSNKNAKIKKFKKIPKKTPKNIEEKKINYINNNLVSNLNSQYLINLGKNELNHWNINNIYNNHCTNDKINVINVNIVENRFINYSFNNIQNILLDNILKNIKENLVLSENVLNLNSILLNNYLQLNIREDVYMNYICKINNLLFLKTQCLNAISSFLNIYNLLKGVNIINNISLINNISSTKNNNPNIQNNIVNLNNYANHLNKNNNNN